MDSGAKEAKTGPADQLFAEAFRRHMAGQAAEAERLYRQLLALDSRHADAWHAFGVLVLQQGRTEEGIRLIQRALSIDDTQASFHSNLGLALQQQGKLDEAVALYQRAIALKPTDIHPYKNLGTALMEHGQPDAAIEAYERALAIKPDFADAHSNLIYALNFISGVDTARQQTRRRTWNEAVARALPRLEPRLPNEGDRKRTKLRIGYVSSHFRHQAATYAFAPAILYHDRNGFEVVCYSDTTLQDDVTARLKPAATRWRDTTALNDDQFAAQIRSDGIDILVDCVGHMVGHRLPVFARKPAPIQLSAWGEPTGTGLEGMDYLLSDLALIPPGERKLFAETIVDLPCFLTYWSPDELPAPGVLPAAANGRITFGSFNRSVKMTPPTLKLWAEILAAVPSARLMLKDASFRNPAVRARISEQLAAAGAVPERIAFLGETPRAEHFAAYGKVDIALDPMPHGGGMTTLDALNMGAPVVTLRGATPSGRLATAILSAIGMTDWIASTPADYVAKAVGLARDWTRLKDVRQSLRPRLAATPAGDPQRAVRALEDSYQRMYAHWCAGKMPAAYTQEAARERS